MPGDLPTHFGKLYRNIQTIEFLIRLLLYKKDNENSDNSKLKETSDEEKLRTVKVGEVIDENWITKSCYFNDVLKAYNTEFPTKALDRERLNNIRNALSHARFFFEDPNLPAVAINAVKLEGELTVVFKEELNESWYNEQIEYTKSVSIEINKNF